MEIVNLLGGPGVGKSTTAAGLFFEMKRLGLSVELVTEYAKDLVWEGRQNLLFEDQLYVFAKQNRRMQRLAGKVDWIITDAPLILANIYVREPYYPAFTTLVREIWDRERNRTYLLERTVPYRPEGRLQDESGARAVDERIERYLATAGIPFRRIGADGAIETILSDLGLVCARSEATRDASP